jgi:hypothetical protein
MLGTEDRARIMEFANAANVYLSHYEGAFTDSNEIDLFRDRVDEKWKQPLLELAKKTGAQDLIDVVSSIDPLDKQSWQRVINGLYKDHEDEYNLYSAGKLLQSAALQTYTAAYLASPEFAASVAGANGLTADTAYDLAGAAQRAGQTIGTGRGPVYGTRFHKAFEEEVKALENPNLRTEVSYLNGRIVPRGTAGSVRLDVVEVGTNGQILNVYDLKTGSATLTTQRIQQIQSHIPGGSNIPVFEVRP